MIILKHYDDIRAFFRGEGEVPYKGGASLKLKPEFKKQVGLLGFKIVKKKAEKAED